MHTARIVCGKTPTNSITLDRTVATLALPMSALFRLLSVGAAISHVSHSITSGI